MQTKLPKVGTTIFTTMSQMANEYQAINLSQGFPNFPIDPLIEELLAKNSKENVHQYPPMSGLPSLLEGIAQLVHTVYKRTINPGTEMLVTAGATQGIFAALQALVHDHNKQHVQTGLQYLRKVGNLVEVRGSIRSKRD